MEFVTFVTALLQLITSFSANPWLVGIASAVVLFGSGFLYVWLKKKLDEWQRDAAKRNSERQHNEVIEREVIDNEDKNNIDNENRSKLDDL